MASQGSQNISLKLLIDKEHNKVVMAETNSDFVDILCSFLTMPMGTIVRLISKQPQPATIGSMTTLYKEMEKLEGQFLQNLAFKHLLLHPKNPCEDDCRKLKLNLDDRNPSKYYICADWNCSRRWNEGLYSTFKNARCNCGKMMDKEISMEKEDVAARSEGYEIFVRGMTKYMVTDDLQVEPMSPSAALILLHKLGLKDMSSLKETTLSIGSEEILTLLKGSLLSKTPLTNLFIKKQIFTVEDLKFEMGNAVQFQGSDKSATDMTLKLVISHSMKKVLYAEVGEDMVDFLFSFLTVPLGSILKLLGGNSSLGSMDNMYKSLKQSEIRSYSLLNLLKEPSLYHGYRCRRNPLGLTDEQCPSLWCRSYIGPETEYTSYTGNLTIEKTSVKPDVMEQELSLLNFVNPVSPTGSTKSEGGFLKGPTMFMVTDDLVFTPLHSMWSLSFLKSTKVPLDDLKVFTVNVGRGHALRLLKASLFSKSVLTDVFVKVGSKSPKQEYKS
ncbi:hypothetical protein NE237_006456 [Protea cynaroides]|uniref:DUF674 domain-containing protein n=1 Tax=Protea cynaroides TaxID=273540 RepID=A0A9Q0KME3_9MAGN|nr:hypothetical protein NE237_006456 [Protea cynaroides]